jgi:FkbM family methyltransferase
MITWLASYPRSGNTLLRLILKNVFDQPSFSKHDDAADIGSDPRLADLVGHQFLTGKWADESARFQADAECKLVKTHDPPEDDSPAIYIVRDGRSACRSFYHYLKEFPHLRARFSLMDVICGFTPFGSWSDHLTDWNPQKRPRTLLLKYEDLLNRPDAGIAQLAEFLQLAPRRNWQNRFDELRPLNPRFFRAGESNDPKTALAGEDAAVFWAQHLDWMRQLDYPIPEPPPPGGPAAHRAWISSKGREFYSLKQRTHEAEQHAWGLGPQIAALHMEIAWRDRQANELRQQIADWVRDSYLSQQHFARVLQDKDQVNLALADGLHQMNTRLRMLLTSRLLHAGWRVGLGETPYWNDPAQDEMTDLLDLTRRADGETPNAVLERMQAALVRPARGGGDMDTALAHLQEKDFSPRVVLDVGAAKGYWSINAGCRWPRAKFFMIDPLLQSEPDLQRLCEDPRFHYLRLAVGDRPGETVIHVATEPDSSSLLLVSNPDPKSHQAVSLRTLDQLLETGQIAAPQLVKIDVQGYELNVLRGGEKVFDSADVFIIEANLFEFMPGCPRLHELTAFMADRGFYPFDFAGFLRRPYQNDLGQVDVVFVSHKSAMVASNRWLNPIPSIEQQNPVLANEAGIVVSVIICTANPRMDIFSRALDALDRQTLARDRFEVIVVDNASRVPLEPGGLKIGRGIDITLVREPIPGLSRARCAGIQLAKGPLLVFVDDDNFLAPDYLERALAIARRESRIGLFGGIAEAELECPIPDWKRPILPHLGIRDHGNEPNTRFSDRWGEWEPIGAGMVARRAVAERFVKMFEEIPQARILGRSGSALLSGEDSLFARAAYREGFACSYQPGLRLTHFIKASRLTSQYMGRVIEGHGRSFVLLQKAIGKPVRPLKVRTAVARYLYRLKDVGRAGCITGRWEIGYAKECQRPSTESAAAPAPPLPELPPPTLPVSVVLCTRNPRADLLDRALESLDRQRLDRSEFEVIVVDNASTQPLQSGQLERLGSSSSCDACVSVDRRSREEATQASQLQNNVADPAQAVPSDHRPMQICLIVEPRVGHIFARSAGIAAARGALIVFVDDDNFLEPDYLSNALRISREQPGIGAFGGIAASEFETPPAVWKLQLLPFLAVRDNGPEPVTSSTDAWGIWEPIGAGLVVRREIARRFVHLVAHLPGAASLGRNQQSLMSGDDALFSRIACRLGYSISYQPALRLTHHIKASRFHLAYLARLLIGHGRTYVRLHRIMETTPPRNGIWRTIKSLAHRIRKQGRAGVMLCFWDLGCALERLDRRGRR